MKPLDSLSRSIVSTLGGFFLLQSAVFLVFFRLWRFSTTFLAVFFAGEAVFYLVIFLFLIKNLRLFYNIQSGAAESGVNGANMITLFRITMLPFLMTLTLVSQGRDGSNHGVALTAAFAVTFASDFLDGRLARKRNQMTYIGKILDSASDYLLLGVIAGAFFHFKLLKTWLFMLIIIRLSFNAVVMLALFLVRRELVPQTTPIGKLTIAVIMVLLVVEAARTLPLPQWLSYAEPAAAAVVGVSIVDKLVFLVTRLRDKGMFAP